MPVESPEGRCVGEPLLHVLCRLSSFRLRVGSLEHRTGLALRTRARFCSSPVPSGIRRLLPSVSNLHREWRHGSVSKRVSCPPSRPQAIHVPLSPQLLYTRLLQSASKFRTAGGWGSTHPEV